MGTQVATICGAKARTGNPCRRPAGWGTDHVGFGACKLHLGASRKHSKAAAREQALTFVRGALGQELDVDPLEGVLMAVRLSYGLVDHWRHRIQTDGGNDDIRDGYAKAITEYARICDIAIKAGVSERQIRVVERLGEQLSLVFEETLAQVKLDARTRQALVTAYASGLARLEEHVIDGTAEDVAA